LLIETFEPDGEMRYTTPDIRYRDGRTKLLDVYAFSAVAREATAAPQVVEFLTAIFADKPQAFQGLHFWNGSQQAMHKDTAYVKVDTNPMHLAATWLALEDVETGTGELEYYVGCHRAPDFLFGGNSKWMESHTEEHDSFLQSLHDDAGRYGQKRTSFLAKAGDVLIWHADLAHGGAPITKPGRTRRSLVTHFTSAGDEPFYRRSSRRRQAELQGCVFTSAYYDVPATASA
jgi:ectoine hydroxylase-related dioxygenase (phytanoyl-CoA dioxygenase family)